MGRRIFARTLHKAPLALAGSALLAAPLFAQQVPAPKPSPTPAAPTVQPLVQPLPAPPPPVVIPPLSPMQAAQLHSALSDLGVAQGLRQPGTAEMTPASEAALVRATLDYAHAVHAGRLDAEDFQADWGLRPAAYDPAQGFADAIKRDRISQWLASLPPPYAGYDGLARGLATYREIEAAGGWDKLAAGPDLALGSTGARVTALRKRLAVENPQVALTGDFDAALKEAVQRAQRRYGLNPTGTVSTQTLAALNVPVGDRIHQIMANMERWRWLPQEMPTTRIQVNIAAAVLTVFEGDQPVMSMKGVTGKPGGGETPMLSSRMHSVVINPPWNVPAGIAQRELFPKGAAYLSANGFKIIGTGANRRLQQQPSHSALGKYKFDFDNPYAVYLHDTPTQATFSRFDRLASHGCIRLEKPADLARLLLAGDPVWTPEKIDETVAAGKTVRVPLTNQPVVFLLYWTAFANNDGTMSFRADPYGWDKVLAAKIEARAARQAVVASR